MLPFGFEREDRGLVFYLKRPDYLQPWNFFKIVQRLLERLDREWWMYIDLKKCRTADSKIVVIHGLRKNEYEVKFTPKAKKR